MVEDARAFLPAAPTLASLREAAAGCTACPLHLSGTQTVFGQGPADAELMLVGEQPGDVEDRSGQPFVGPAGQLLDRALAEAGIDRSRAYVTNAVKHFKWEPRGKRRIHGKPNAGEVRACRPWLEAEIALIAPRTIVCLGATAAKAILGPDFRVTQHRGGFTPSTWAPRVLATIHPSAILRIREDEQRQAQYRALVADLRVAAGP
jgi:DNA polymerase